VEAPSLDKVPAFLKRTGNVLIDCRVQLDEFEGPLDLLLYLIKNHEFDLVNLPISKITRQYLDYLDYMREMNLDLASEYLVMAATLTYLKSAAILPQDPEDPSLSVDPRTQLIRRLIELKCYKELANHIAKLPRLRRDFFLCKNTGAEEIAEGMEPEIALGNPFQLTQAYQELIERRKTHVHQIYMEEVPVAKSVERLSALLTDRESFSFNELLPQVCKAPDFVSTFLALLELTRMQFTTINQTDTFGHLEIRRKVDAVDMVRANNMIRGLSWG
jgi:segregation and condensation protein A